MNLYSRILHVYTAAKCGNRGNSKAKQNIVQNVIQGECLTVRKLYTQNG